MSTNKVGIELIVPQAAARRLSNQIDRAYRGTYGAGTGLKAVVRSVSLLLLRAGSSPEVVSRALTDYVLTCPTPKAVAGQRTSSDALRTSALVTLTAECVSDAATELARAGGDRGAFAIPIVG